MILGIDGSNLNAGGGLRHLLEFLNNSKPQDFGFKGVILWVSPETAKQIKLKKKWLKINEVEAFSKNIISRTFWRYRYMKPAVEKHCNVLFSPGGIILGTKVPEVTMSRNMQPFDSFEKAKSGFGKERLRLELLTYVQTRSFRNAQTVIFLTDYAKSFLSKKLGLTGGEVVSHGCSDTFKQKPKEQKQLTQQDKINILYVSTLNTYKHQLEVLDAIEVLWLQYPNLCLTLVGDEHKPYSDRVKVKINNLTSKGVNITFTGKVGLDELTEYYHHADLFLYASSCENLPNILLEAMSSGIPIACSNIEPMPTVLKANGIYFDPFKPVSITTALKTLIQSASLREEYSLKAYVEASKYSWPSCIHKTFSILQKVANSNNVSNKI